VEAALGARACAAADVEHAIPQQEHRLRRWKRAGRPSQRVARDFRAGCDCRGPGRAAAGSKHLETGVSEKTVGLRLQEGSGGLLRIEAYPRGLDVGSRTGHVAHPRSHARAQCDQRERRHGGSRIL